MPGPRLPVVPPCAGRRIGFLCIAIGMCSLISLIGDLCSPMLLPRQPLVLVLLSPRTAYLVATAHEVPFVLFFGVAVLRLCAVDPLHYMLGRTTGPAALAAARRIDLLRRLVDRVPPAGPIWLVGIAGSPTAKMMCAAGAAGLPSRRVAAANVVGTAGRVLVIWAAGRAVPGAGATMAAIAPWLAVPGGAVVVATAIVRRRRRRAETFGAPDPGAERLAPPAPVIVKVADVPAAA